MSGSRCLELGAGMGVAGAALALMGGDVTFTDLESVLPLLRQNVDANLNPAVVRRAWGRDDVARPRDGRGSWVMVGGP